MILIKVGPAEFQVSPEFAQVLKNLLSITSKNSQKKVNSPNSENPSSKIRSLKSEIILYTNDDIYKIPILNLVYCRSSGNYTTFYLKSGERIMISKSMKVVEQMVPDESFVRCHQSFLVNAKFVDRYNRNGVLILSNGERVPVSGSRKARTFEAVFGIKNKF